MKYQRLTKEQFEALHLEFAKFLASQSITADEWRQIKKEKPELAEQELDVFSDLIWEGVLAKVNYLEHIHTQQIFLFKIEKQGMFLIVVKVEEDGIDLTTSEGFTWLESNVKNETVTFYTASKAYSDDRNADIFSLIVQGAIISEGELYEVFRKII